jgi:uncharacterized membrane protein YcgQ (UPF0703/DUF1980 family)
MCKNKFSGKSLIIAFTILLMIVSFCTISCTKANNDIIEIKEKMFAANVSNVYLNVDDYLGKTIKLEGIFKSEKYYGAEETYCFVVRYGPGGCCGYDSNVGFEVKWDKNRMKPYPDSELWVEATGVLKIEEEGSAQYLYLDLSSLNILSKRGAEVVFQ